MQEDDGGLQVANAEFELLKVAFHPLQARIETPEILEDRVGWFLGHARQVASADGVTPAGRN